MINIDLHNHLGRNGANPGFDETIDIAYNSLGQGGIFGICNDGPVDHRYENFINQEGGKYERVPTGDEKRAVYILNKDITVVGVEEVEPKQGHFLVVGMPENKKIWTDKNPPTLEDALKKADDFGYNARIVVHPIGNFGLADYLINNPRLFEQFDGWEVYNASAALPVPKFIPLKANQTSMAYYINSVQQHGLGACAFTDGHSAGVIGRSYTQIPDFVKITFEDTENFIEFLRQGIKSNKNIENLHMKPAKLDALKHCVYMGLNMVFGSPI